MISRISFLASILICLISLSACNNIAEPKTIKKVKATTTNPTTPTAPTTSLDDSTFYDY